MCCFSGPVDSVTNTQIFARWLAPDGNYSRQALVYQMHYVTQRDVAMILPLPVARGTGEKAVKFINLEKHEDFFDRLRRTFAPPPMAWSDRSVRSAAAPKAKLEVVQVGSFEASYVPTVADFSRLDARFRLPAETWDQIPAYAGYGFAVFKLKPSATKVHPMAFTFPQAPDQAGLFFPTVHIHDGKVHKEEHFDHTLYTQKSEHRRSYLMDWEESDQLARAQFDSDAEGLLDRLGHVYRKRLNGKFRNQDVWV